MGSGCRYVHLGERLDPDRPQTLPGRDPCRHCRRDGRGLGDRDRAGGRARGCFGGGTGFFRFDDRVQLPASPARETLPPLSFGRAGHPARRAHNGLEASHHGQGRGPPAGPLDDVGVTTRPS